jgi:hypothetical protein
MADRRHLAGDLGDRHHDHLRVGLALVQEPQDRPADRFRRDLHLLLELPVPELPTPAVIPPPPSAHRPRREQKSRAYHFSATPNMM